jgi:hypothetical protein
MPRPAWPAAAARASCPKKRSPEPTVQVTDGRR